LRRPTSANPHLARSLRHPAAALLSLTVVPQLEDFMAFTKAGAGLLATVALTVVVLAIAMVTSAPKARADDSEAQALNQVQRELRQVRADRARDRRLIEKLEQKLDQVESQDNQVRTTNQQLQTTTSAAHAQHRCDRYVRCDIGCFT
jgi:septal ring factor EnvC (AmiA/AmiB activator)